MIAFVTIGSPNSVPTAYGVCSRSYIEAFERFEEVEVIAVPPRAARRGAVRRLWQLGAWLRGRPSFAGPVDLKLVAHEIETIARTRPRAIVLDHLRVAASIDDRLERHGVPLWYLAHNHEATGARSIQHLAKNPLVRLFLAVDAARVARVERRVAKACDVVLTLTAEDQARFESIGEVFAVAVPPMIEERSLPVPSAGTAATSVTVALISSFNWSPKRWNAQWILRDVMPRVWERHPKARLMLVGAGASRVAQPGDRVDVFDSVPDVRPFFERSHVILVPERQASGLKFKTVQAAAAGKPIVSTPEGIEGSGLVPGRSVLVADDADAFGSRICDLVEDDALAASLGEAARIDIASQFSPDKLLQSYRDLIGRDVVR